MNQALTSGTRPRYSFRRVLQRVLVGLMLVSLLVLTPTTALAQKKKKKEEELPTKSYVLPYLVVMAMVSVGLMTVCRPGKRQDRPDDKKADEE
jgi:hypothetical protein